MRNVVPFKSPEPFTRLGIDWTREAASEAERSLRQAYLTYERGCGPNGLVSLLLLAAVSRRQGSVARDLQDASDYSEILLTFKLRTHQNRALEYVQSPAADDEPLLS